MVEGDLLDAFNDCVDRLADGASVEECLRLYPQYAGRLRLMLEAGLTVRRAQPSRGEILMAQERVEARIVRALEAPRRTREPLARRWLSLAAGFLLVFALGTGLVAQESLPGDALYGVKRLTEALVTLVSSEEDPFAQRRIDEIKRLLALNRAEEVRFRGNVELINGTTWLVAGLPLSVEAGTPGADGVQVGDRVEVEAFTTPLQELIATQITLIEDNSPEPTSTITPTLTVTTPPAQPTPTPTVPVTLTETPALTSTPTPAPTLTITLRPTATRTPAVTASATACVSMPPADWVSYRVQAGDTLSALAGSTGTTVDELMAVNCIEDARRVLAGQIVYLPTMPVQVQPSQPPGDDRPGDDAGGNDNQGSASSGSGSSGSSGSSGGSGGGNDNADNEGDDSNNDNDDINDNDDNSDDDDDDD